MTRDELRKLPVPQGWVLRSGMAGPFWAHPLPNAHCAIIYLEDGMLAVHWAGFGFITWEPEVNAQLNDAMGHEARRLALLKAQTIIDNCPTRHGGNWTRAYNRVAPGARKPC